MQTVFLFGPLAQLGERQVRNLEVRGSIPLWSTIGVLSEPHFLHREEKGFDSTSKNAEQIVCPAFFLLCIILSARSRHREV